MKFNLLKGGKKKKTTETFVEASENFDPEVTQTGLEKTSLIQSIFSKMLGKKKGSSTQSRDTDQQESQNENTEERTKTKQDKSLFGRFFSKKSSPKSKKSNNTAHSAGDDDAEGAEGADNRTDAKNAPKKSSFRPKQSHGLHPLVQLLILVLPWFAFLFFTPNLVKREKNLTVVLDKDLEKIEKTLTSLLEKEKQIQSYKDQQKLGQSKVGVLKTIMSEKSIVAQALDRMPSLVNDNLWLSGTEFQKTIDGNWFYIEGFTDQDPKVAELMFAVKGIDLFETVELVFTKRVPLGNTDIVNFKIRAQIKSEKKVSMNDPSALTESDEPGKTEEGNSPNSEEPSNKEEMKQQQMPPVNDIAPSQPKEAAAPSEPAAPAPAVKVAAAPADKKENATKESPVKKAAGGAKVAKAPVQKASASTTGAKGVKK